MLVAAEASGDNLGAGLAKELKRRLGEGVRFVGVGGAQMALQGVASPFDIGELSVLGLISASGDRDGAQALWNVYFQRLVALARVRLRGTPRRAADEEDVALSAFDSFFRGVERGRFPQLGDRVL